MNRRQKPLTEHQRRIQMLGLIGYVPGVKADQSTKSFIKGMLIWVYGLKHYAGKPIMLLPIRKIATFIRFYAPSNILAQAKEADKMNVLFGEAGR